MRGDLAEGVVPELLREIYVGRRNGWLRLVRGAEQQSLRLRRGHIVNAHTNVLQERLGEMLVRRGLLSQRDFDRATEIVIRDKRKLGEVLAELGAIDASGLEDAIALHVHEMLAKVVAWTEGSYEFEEEADRPTGEVTLKLSTGELILEAVRAIRDPAVVREGLGNLDAVLAPSSDPLLRFQKLTLSPADGFVLSRIDGTTTAREIVQLIPLPVEEVEQSLLGLLSTGAIEQGRGERRTPSVPVQRESAAAAGEPPHRATPPAPPPAATTRPSPAAPPLAAPAAPPLAAPAAPPPLPAQPPADSPVPAPAADGQAERRREILEAWEGLKTRNHFEVLGLPRAVDEAAVKDAYFRLAKRFHPDVHHGSSLGDLHDQLEAVFIRLGEAYEALRDPRRRADYEQRLGRARPAAGAAGLRSPSTPPGRGPAADPDDDAQSAEDAIQRASKLHEQEKYWDAIQLLEPVVEKASGKLRTRGMVLLARCYAKNPNWARRAEEMLLGVTRADPAAADAWALLGQIYVGKTMHARALSMYRKVLELRPDDEEASRFVAENGAADDPLPEEGTGFLRRLFRK